MAVILPKAALPESYCLEWNFNNSYILRRFRKSQAFLPFQYIVALLYLNGIQVYLTSCKSGIQQQ